jgi:hypothetical protein
MKTSELVGPALDWAVAKCENIDVRWSPPHEMLLLVGYAYMSYQPSKNWTESGPIIEREGISLLYQGGDGYSAYLKFNQSATIRGPTPLIAAMRCYVASKLGDEIDIPEELK